MSGGTIFFFLHTLYTIYGSRRTHLIVGHVDTSTDKSPRSEGIPSLSIVSPVVTRPSKVYHYYSRFFFYSITLSGPLVVSPLDQIGKVIGSEITFVHWTESELE